MNNFHLSKHAKMFVYSPDYYYQMGAFTSENNQQSKLFATSYIPGDELIVEVYLPQDELSKNTFTISEVGYMFKDIPEFKENNAQRDFGSSLACMINANCPEGNNKNQQKSATVRILVRSFNNAFWCTGTTIRANVNECKNYVLSADHCADNAREQDYNQWIFYWNYQSPNCNNPNVEGILANQSLNGCKKVVKTNTAGDEDSDLLLVELNNSIPSLYNPYYSGWDKREIQEDSTYSVHHPAGDIKKISTFNNRLNSDTWGEIIQDTHWEVRWSSTVSGHGATEGGSSGSALFSRFGLIVGTLTGGTSNCDNASSPDYYGKFSHHWDKNGNSNDLKLQPWLDPTGSLDFMIGSNVCGLTSVQSLGEALHDIKLFPNPANNQFAVLWKNDSQKANIQLFDLNGRQVLRLENLNAGEPISIQDLTAGMYMLVAKIGEVETRIKVLVQ